MEDNSHDFSPHDLVTHSAENKAMSVVYPNSEAMMIAADTFVIIAGSAPRKPANTVEILQIISAPSGRWYYAYTDTALIRNEASITDVSRTRIHFRK